MSVKSRQGYESNFSLFIYRKKTDKQNNKSLSKIQNEPELMKDLYPLSLK